MALITGTPGNDTLTGTAQDDTFDGGAGNDSLRSFEPGNDTYIINLGYGRDEIVDFNATKIFFPGALYDVATMFDQHLFDVPVGQSPGYAGRHVVLIDGSVIFDGNPGFYNVGTSFAAADVTTLPFVAATSGGVTPVTTVTGTGADEILAGTLFAQTMHGMGGNDIIYANDGADTVFGGDGADYISAGHEYPNGGVADAGDDDLFDGGGGIDTISYSGMAGGVQIDLAAGYALGAKVGRDTLAGFEVAVGSLGNDVLIGTNDHNTLTGSFGDDYFYGRNGNDLMRGGWGVDVLLGEDGNDALHGDGGQDYLIGGAGNDTYFGGEGVDVMIDISPSGVNTFFGGDGGDYFYSGASADTAFGGDGNDIFVMNVALGAGDVVHGEAGQDYFYMGAAADQVFGGSGVDVILGGGGSDVIDAGADVDYIWFEGLGAQTLIVRPGYSAEVVFGFGASGGDVVRFIDTGFTSFSQVQSTQSDQGGYTIITTPDESAAVWLIGITPGELTAGNFLFA